MTEKTLFQIIVIISLCGAQPISISGSVVDREGVGISGANVELEKAALTATTDNDGNFILDGIVDIVKQGSTVLKRKTISFTGNNQILVYCTRPAEFTLRVYDSRGRLVVALSRTMIAGNNSVALPAIRNGLNICVVTLNGKKSIYRYTGLGYSEKKGLVQTEKANDNVRHSKRAEQIDDIIKASAEGYLTYRAVITESDTNGIRIVMIPSEGTMTDRDGNVYQTIKYGDQVWTATNLRTTKYNDGETIPLLMDSDEWKACTTGAYSFCDFAFADRPRFGALYNWYTVATGKLAPEGWHVPSGAEWDTLVKYLVANDYTADCSIGKNYEAQAMSAKADWQTCRYVCSPGWDLNLNNASGFSAVGCGYSDNGIYSNYRNQLTYWWTTTEVDSTSALAQYLSYIQRDLGNFEMEKTYGMSVRLVRDYVEGGQ